VIFRNRGVDMNIDYASALRQLRAELNLSQHEFAEFLNVSFVSVNRWENGKHEPTVLVKERLKKLFKQYNIELEEESSWQ
jgi:putative transcriptional regulator